MSGLLIQTNIRKTERAFTLVELLISTVMGAFIGLVAVGTLRTFSRSAEMVDKNSRREAEVRFAADMIQKDLINLYRGRVSGEMRLVGGTKGSSNAGRSSRLILYTVSRGKARSGQPEGDVYEVEYFVREGNGRGGLYRRHWPNPDRESEPGGVLTLIGEGINFFDVRFFDGENWRSEWREEWRSIPGIIEVRIACGGQGSGEEMIGENFLVNYFRKGWSAGSGAEQEEGAEETGETR